MEGSEEKTKVTPQKAIEILKKHGTIVTIEDAEKILNLMYQLAKLGVRQLINRDNNNENC